MRSDEPADSEMDTVTGVVGPGVDASATGKKVGAYAGPVEYEGYQREGIRHGWTRQPDGDGRYHALTLRREEDGPSAWEVTADQPFETLDEARAWARRLFGETE